MKPKYKKVMSAVIIPLLLFTGVAAAVLLNYKEASEREFTHAKQILVDSAKEQSTILRTKIESEFALLESFAAYTEGLGTVVNGEHAGIIERVVAAGEFYHVGIVDKNGKAYLNTGDELDVSSRRFFTEALAGKRSIDYIIKNNIDGKALFVFSVPVMKGGEVDAVFFGSYEVEGFVSLLSSEVYSGEGYSFICDSAGHLLVEPASEGFIWNYYFEEDPSASLLDALKNVKFTDDMSAEKLESDMQNQKNGVFLYETGDGKGRYGIYEALGLNDWYLYNVIDSSLINAKAGGELRIALVSSGIVLVFSFLGFARFTYRERKNQVIIGEEREALHRQELEEQQLIKEHNERFKLALQNMTAAFWDYDIKTREIIQSDFSIEQHGFGSVVPNVPESLIESGFVHPDSVDALRKMYDRLIAGEPTAEGVFRVQSSDRNGWWYEQVQYVNLFDDEGKPYRAIGIGRDVTEQQELLEAVQTDSLTGLLNHGATLERISKVLVRKDYDGFNALFVIDIDHFKEINDSLGHQTGDEVLVRVAKIINDSFRAEDILGRVGGDEYLILLRDVPNMAVVERKAEQLVQALQMTCDDGEKQYDLSASVGVAVQNAEEAVEDLYHRADKALYRAKEAGRNQYYIDEELWNDGGEPRFLPESQRRECPTTIQLQMLLENLDGGVMLIEVGEQLRIQYVSPGFYRIAGTEPPKGPGRTMPLCSMIGDEELHSFERAIRGAARTGKAMEFSFSTEVSGKTAWRHIRAIRIHKEESANPVMIAMITDITEMKRTGALLEGIVSSAPMGIGVFDGSIGFKPVFVNERLMAMLGCSMEEFFCASGEDATYMIQDGDMQTISEFINRLKTEGHTQDITFRPLPRKGGEQRYLRAAAAKISVIGAEDLYLIMFSDVTKQRELDQMLVRSGKEFGLEYENQKANFLLENCAIEAYEVNIAEHTLECSRAARMRYGFPEGKIENIPEGILSLGVIHNDSVEAYRSFYSDIYMGVPSGSCVLRVKMPDGSYTMQRLAYQTIYDESGTPLRAMAYTEGIENTDELKFSFDQEDKIYELLGREYVATLRINLTRGEVERFYPGSVGKHLPGDHGYDRFLQGMLDRYVEPVKAAVLAEALSSGTLVEQFNSGKRGVHHTFLALRGERLKWMLFSGKLNVSPYNGDIYLFGYIKDIDASRKAELALPQKPQKDPVTGTYRRQTLRSLIEASLKHAENREIYCGFMVIRIKNFEEIRSRETERSFERLRIAVSRKLFMLSGTSAIVGALSESRLAVFYPAFANEKQGEEYAGRIMTIMNSPNFLTLPHEQRFVYFMGAVCCKVKDASFELMLEAATCAKRRATELNPIQFGNLGGGAGKGAVDFDVLCQHDADDEKLKNSSVFRRCAEMIAVSTVPCSPLNQVLELLGRHFNADRAYILELREPNMLCNTYEWCADGVSSEKGNLQNIPLSDLPTFEAVCETRSIFLTHSAESVSEKEKRIFKEQNITGLFICPLLHNNSVFGFVGLDNPGGSGDRHELIAVSQIIAGELIKTSLVEQERVMRQVDIISGAMSRSRLTEVILKIDMDSVSSVGIFMANIMGLAAVNTECGLGAGDRMLRVVANQLKGSFGNDNVYRYGDSVFVVVVEDASSSSFYDKAEAAAATLDISIGSSVACGYTWSATADDVNRLILNSNVMMLAAKEEKELQQNERFNRQKGVVETRLMSALDRGLALVYLQPKADIKGGELCGAEALIRMKREDGSIVSPLEFVPLLEKLRLIHHIDHFVLRRVAECISNWKKEGRTLFPISLNYSRSTLLEPEAVERILNVCREFDIDRNLLEIEITESLGDIDTNRLAMIAKRFSDAGINLSLDDFGAKYSSLSVFGSVLFSTVKLDKSMIDLLPTNTRMLDVAQSVISLCHKQSIRVVAEGVEQETQVDVLRKINCDVVQGYLINKPLPITDFESLYFSGNHHKLKG